MKTSLGALTLEKIKALTENSAIAQMQQASKLYENSVMAQMQQASKFYENSTIAQMQQASKLYENSAIAQMQQASKLMALNIPIKDLLNIKEFSSFKNLFNQAEIDLINFWKEQNTQY